MMKDYILENRTVKQTNLEVVPQVILFDMCGTLLDSKLADLKAINTTLESFNKPEWSVMRAKKDPLKSMKHNFPNFFGEDADKAYQIYLDNLTANIDEMHFFDGALQNLQNCKQQGMKTGVITNRDKMFMEALKRNKKFQEMNQSLDLVMTADEIGATKPDPRVVEAILEKMDYKCKNKKAVLFVGDAMADVSVAVNFGCTPVLLLETITDINKPFLNKYKNDLKIAENHQELNSFINASWQHFRHNQKQSYSQK